MTLRRASASVCLTAAVVLLTRPMQAQVYGTSTYRAYGDSITAGLHLPNPSSQAYPALLAKDLGIATLVNSAISGAQACDAWPTQLGPAGDNPSLYGRTLRTFAFGTNDVGVKHSGAYEQTFSLCYEAVLSFAAIPSDWKYLAGTNVINPAITTAGTMNYYANNVGSFGNLVSGGPGSGFSLAFSTQAAASSVYVWYYLDPSYTGTWTYGIDGSTNQGSTASPTPITTQNGTTSSMGVIRIPNVGPGSHTFSMTQGTAVFGFYGLGVVPHYADWVGLPVVAVSDIPLAAASSTTYNNDSPAYNADISAIIFGLRNDGLDVRQVATREFMTGDAAEMYSDGLHLSPLGDVHVTAAYESALPYLLGLPAAPARTGPVVTSNYIVQPTDAVVFANCSSACTITLPNVAPATRKVTIFDYTGNVTIVPDTANGASFDRAVASMALAVPRSSYDFINFTSTWYVLNPSVVPVLWNGAAEVQVHDDIGYLQLSSLGSATIAFSSAGATGSSSCTGSYYGATGTLAPIVFSAANASQVTVGGTSSQYVQYSCKVW